VPNLITDRGFWVTGLGLVGNVRRLMYQSLIWRAVLSNDARRMGAPLDAQRPQRLPDPLIDGMRRNLQLGRNLLGTEVQVDEPQAVQLAGRKLGHPRRHLLRSVRALGLTRVLVRSVRVFQCNTHPAQHAALPSRVRFRHYDIF
jgi:hypothetical protein